MSNIDKQALPLRMRNYLETALKSGVKLLHLSIDELEGLLDELGNKEEQRANWFQMAQKLGEDLDAAEKHIAELEAQQPTTAATDVLAERQRQMSSEGWTPEHDDEHEHGELADAAGCYALFSELFYCAGEPPRKWPWSDEWWKPTNRRRDLVKSAALLLAEIERLDRAAGGIKESE